MRTRGWWTVEPSDVAVVIEKYGRLVVGEKGELMVEFVEEKAAQGLSKALSEHFGDQVLLSP
jgi:ribosomal protein L6P/L9E